MQKLNLDLNYLNVKYFNLKPNISLKKIYYYSKKYVNKILIVKQNQKNQREKEMRNK